MSSVDNRIVEMQFNNRRFEENARETMSTLDKLKEKLKFKDSARELEEFQSTADSFNLNRIANAVESLGDKFTLLGQIGIGVLDRIASKAINVGETLLRSLSIDQIRAGMTKYEQETNVIQTLYGALKPKGTQLEEIYDAMELLAAYSDETSYSYTQMADAVSKFVNAGVDLEKSEKIIEGISNAAALAGIDIHSTEIIYRNFADAIGKGKFTLHDWNSIKLAHMDTQWLKEAFILEAIAQGKLDKSGRIQTKAEKRDKKGNIIQAAEYKSAYDDFESTLSAGWLDTDILSAVMIKYATRDLEGYGKEAFAAAQNAKTFTDVLDALKDSISSGWSRTFRIIFGDLEEAIAFFTPMANAVIEFTSAIDEARNAIFTKWRGFGGRDSMINTLKTLWESFTDVAEIIRKAFTIAFDTSFYPSAKELVNSLDKTGGYIGHISEQIYNLTKLLENAATAFQMWLNGKTANGSRRIILIQNIFMGLFSVINIVREAIGGVFTFLGEIFKQLSPTFDAVLKFLSDLGFDLNFIFNKQLSANGTFGAIAKSLAAIFVPITSRLPKIIDWIKDLYKRIKLFWKNNSKFRNFRHNIKLLFDSFIKFIPKAIDSLINFGASFIEMVRNSDEWKAIVDNYNKYIVPLVDKLYHLSVFVAQLLSDFFDIDTSDESTLWGKIKKRFSVFDKLGPYLQNMWNELKEKIPWLQDIEDWWNTDPIINEIKAWVAEIAHAIDVFLSEDTSGNTSIIGKIKQRFEAMWDEFGPWLTNKWNEYKEKFPFLQQIEDFLSPIFGWGKEADKASTEGAEETEKSIGFIESVWIKIQEFVSNIDFGKLALFVLAVFALIKVYKAIKTLFGWASIGENIAEAIENIGGFFEELQKTLKTNRMLARITAVMEIAASIWLLADALVKISEMNWDQVAIGLATMAGLFLEEGGFMFLMTKFNEGPGKISSVAMIGTAAAMWILADALLKVSNLDWDQVAIGLATMGGLFLGHGLFTTLVNRFGSISIFQKSAIGLTSMIGIAASMWLLADALLKVSNLNWDQVEIGLATMGGLFVENGLFIGLLNRFASVDIFHKRATGFLTMIGIAVSMWLLGKSLKDLATMSWDQIEKGLTAMGGLFLETGAFMVLVNRFGSVGLLEKRGASVTSMLGVAGSIYLLGQTLKDLSGLGWKEIKKGLVTMGGLFLEEGAFMVIIGALSKKDLIKPDAVNATTGILAYGLGEMGKALAEVGKMQWDEILRGIVALAGIMAILGVFVGVMSKFSKITFKEGFGMDAVAGAIWILVQAFMPLTTIESWDHFAIAIAALGSIAVVLGLFCGVMGALKSSIKGTLGVIVSAIALAALMVAFAFALTLIKDVDTKQVLAFGAAMLLVSGAMVILAATLQVFSKMSLGAALKGTLVMVIAAAGLAAAVALILTIVGQAVQDFSSNIAVVGANLVAYSEQVERVNYDAVGDSVTMLKELSGAFVEIGAKDYGKLETFRTNLTLLGSSIKIFGLNTANLNLGKITSTTSALKTMATDLSGLKSVSDVGTTIGNIAGALKLYHDSMSGITFGEIPDAAAIQMVFNSLKGAIPNDEDMAEVVPFASKGNDMTNFAIGLENIATAISSFSTTAKDLDFDNIQKAIDALSAISRLDTSLQTTSVTHIGPFAKEVNEQKQSLSTFAEDIIALGTALNDFGTNISTVDTDKLKEGTGALSAIADLNKALPPTGGISQWLTGTQSLTTFAANLRLLGGGAVAFSQAIGDQSFNAASVKAAGDALIKIAEVNAKLPKTGGISSWFTGDESLSSFSSGLGVLGEGVVEFVNALGETKISDDIVDAVDFLRRIASIQVALGNTASWYTMDTLGGELSKAVTSFGEANDKLLAITTWADTTGFEHLLSYAVDQQIKLGNTAYTKNLKDIGTSVKDFFNEIWEFTKSWNGGDSGKLDKVTDSVVSIFTTLNDVFVNSESEEGFVATGENILTFLMNGFKDENSIVKTKNAVDAICKAIIERAMSYTGKNKAFYNVGTWIPAGLGDGIWDNRYAAINAAVDVMNEAIKAAAEAGGIESPSKEFARLGMYSDIGFAQGLRDSVYMVDSAAGEVSQSALDTVLSDMQAIQNLPLDQMEINPTIRPVLDTSDISNRAGMIDGLLGGARTIGFNTRQLEAQAQILGDTTAADINSINQQIAGLSDQLAHLEETIANIKMVTDTGALVGAMSTKVDKAMGSMYRRAERGN